MLRNDFNWLDSERFRTVSAEHCDQLINDDFRLRFVGTSDIKHNILGLQRNLGVIGVDDWRHGTYLSLGVVNDGVNRRIFDDMKILSEILILFVECHHFFSSHFLGLVQWSKFDLRWRQCFVHKWWCQSIQVMRTHGYKGSVSTQVGVQLILQCNERIIPSFVKFDSSQNRTSRIRTNLSCGFFNGKSCLWLRWTQFVLRRFTVSQEFIQCLGNTLDTQHIVSIRRNLNLQLGPFVSCTFIGGVFI